MRDLAAFYIPKSLDEPEKILFFTLQEFGLFMAPFGVGMLLGHTIKGLVCACALLVLYKKFNKSNLNIVFLVYWYLPSWCLGLDYLVPSCYRIFV